MGDMADDVMRWEEVQSEHVPSDEEMWEQTMETYSDPFIWVRSNGNTVHIKDMNHKHLGNAVRHLEKSMEGSKDMPAIYFNMLKRIFDEGLGITIDQTGRLIAVATKVPKPKRLTFDVWTGIGPSNKDVDFLLALESEDGIVNLNVVDHFGDVRYGVARFNSREFIIHRAPEGMEIVLPPKS